MIKFLNKVFLVLLVSVVLFSQGSFVLASFGNACNNSTKTCESGEQCCCLQIGVVDEGICGNSECSNVICSFSKWTSLEQFMKAITDFIFYVGVIVAPLMIVIGGFVFLTSGGESGRITLGKNIMKWAIIGLAVILFARGAQSIIKSIITGS